MTPAQIQMEFHGSDSNNATRTSEIARKNNRVKTVLDAVCNRFRLSAAALLLVPPGEVGRMIREVDPNLLLDDAGVSGGVRLYQQLVMEKN